MNDRLLHEEGTTERGEELTRQTGEEESRGKENFRRRDGERKVSECVAHSRNL